ncbi:MAG: C39 family peptidase [Polyangiaceae bacterium]|nr:C39 family peptidase [Polyangiaceae bacterium]MCB9647677.1 C39 family peptidase [Deltaproteobacteria bacterium]
MDFATFAQEAYMQQELPQWCWAASVSMIFQYHAHPVSQARIVGETYGSVVDLPADALTIARQLNRCWVDDSGYAFVANLTGLYDGDTGLGSITNANIIQELDQDRPLIIANQSHAMILTAIEYHATPTGPYVTSVGVFDPWPGIGARVLAPEEFYPAHLGGSTRFLATLSTSSIQVCPAPPPSLGGGGCTSIPGTDLLLDVLLAGATILCLRPRKSSRTVRSDSRASNGEDERSLDTFHTNLHRKRRTHFRGLPSREQASKKWPHSQQIRKSTHRIQIQPRI